MCQGLFTLLRGYSVFGSRMNSSSGGARLAGTGIPSRIIHGCSLGTSSRACYKKPVLTVALQSTRYTLNYPKVHLIPFVPV